MFNKHAKGIIIQVPQIIGLQHTPSPAEIRKKKRKKKRRLEVMDSFGGIPTIVVLPPDPAIAAFQTLITDLGGNTLVVAAYLALCNKTLIDGNKVSDWADYRAAGGGPTLTQATDAARPLWDGASINFDAIDDRIGSAAAGRLSELNTGLHTVAMVAERPSAQSRGYFSFTNATLHLYRSGAAETSVAADGVTTAFNPVAPTGVRALHARRTQAGGNVQTFCRLGSGGEVASAPAATAVVAVTGLHVGIHTQFNWFGDIKVKALIVYKGDDWTSGGKFAIFNTFAATYLGATL